ETLIHQPAAVMPNRQALHVDGSRSVEAAGIVVDHAPIGRVAVRLRRQHVYLDVPLAPAAQRIHERGCAERPSGKIRRIVESENQYLHMAAPGQGNPTPLTVGGHAFLSITRAMPVV